jgi:hypothetical protein
VITLMWEWSSRCPILYSGMWRFRRKTGPPATRTRSPAEKFANQAKIPFFPKNLDIELSTENRTQDLPPGKHLTFPAERLIVKSPIKRSAPESSPFKLCCDLWK